MSAISRGGRSLNIGGSGELSGRVVVNSVDEVWEYFEEEGIDMEGMEGDEILEANEVFDVGDGRYLIVEG